MVEVVYYADKVTLKAKLIRFLAENDFEYKFSKQEELAILLDTSQDQIAKALKDDEYFEVDTRKTLRLKRSK